MSHPRTILIVQPPPSLPGHLSPLVRIAEQVLERDGHRVDLFNAADDFLANYALDARLLRKRATDLIDRNAFPFPDPDAGAMPMVPDPLVDDPPEGRALLSHIGSQRFTRPMDAVQSLGWVDLALNLVSLSHGVLHLDRRGFSHAGLLHLQDLKRFAVDQADNPFFDYAVNHCRPTRSPASCDELLFVIAGDGQLAPAVTMAGRWLAMWPRLAVRFVCAAPDVQLKADALVPRGATESVMPPTVVESIRHSWASEEVGDVLYRALPAVEESVQFDRCTDGDARIIVWRQPEGQALDTDTLARSLYPAAKAGHWNHLVIREEKAVSPSDPLMRFVLDNPNFIHSWSLRSLPGSFCSDGIQTIPFDVNGYGRTRSLPSVPLWTALQDPPYLQAYLARYGAKSLARMHVVRQSDGDRHLFQVGSRLQYRFTPPGQLPEGYLDEICCMVEAGGSVGTQWVRHNLERAYLIGYVEENGVIVGNSSLKYPRQEYIEAVSRQSGIDLRNYLERGYTSVRPAYRGLGIGAKLLEGLTRRTGDYKIFSVIAENNIATQKMAIRNRTRRVATFFSQRAQKEMSVWIPEWMLPEGVVLPAQPDVE